MGVQGITKAEAGLQKQRMCRCLEDETEGRPYFMHRSWISTGVLNLSWHTMSRPSCPHKSADCPWEVSKQRGLRVTGLNCEFPRDRICSNWPGCPGDPQLGWSCGAGNLQLMRPNGYLLQRIGAFLVLHCAG